MGICELCGKERKTRTVKEEGATIEACYICSPGTEKNVSIRKVPIFRERSAPVNIPKKTYELIDNYGKTIRTARETRKMTIEELAKKMNISTGYFHKIENGTMTPDQKTIKIIEKNLNISITTRVESCDYEDENDKKETTKPGILTLGDIMKDKLKGLKF